MTQRGFLWMPNLTLCQDKLRATSSDMALQTSQKTNKYTLEEWIYWSVSIRVSWQFLLRQMCWFRSGTFSFVLGKMGLHCSYMKPAKSEELQGFFWGHHILKSSLQNPCHPLWFSTDSSRFPHGSFFLLPDQLQDSDLLLLHGFYPWRRMAAFSSCSLSSSSVDSWVCSHSNMMHYVCFDCPLVRNRFIHNPVNVTTLTSLEKEEQDLPVPFQ